MLAPHLWTASWKSLRRAMVKVDLKGIHRVASHGSIYYYAWRGGPRLRGRPGTPEFMASYNEAIEARRIPAPDRFRALVTRYRSSPEYKNLSASTHKNWSPWLDRVGLYFGEPRIVQFDRPEKIRKVIRVWRDKWTATPRTADYGMQVLSRVLASPSSRATLPAIHALAYRSYTRTTGAT
jgi:hypothetical protein